ncbi:hypothetical protein WN51_10041 [Melipona quadrifasciata]|uniref:Uncharacterized protein n=1 Tax=Melipona quadrifasciata TaxID=166423 RepID=A0A0M9ACL7_9HYME|nr:hypothetical protein WN51_10041 [Melipona quadrifasciata]
MYDCDSQPVACIVSMNGVISSKAVGTYLTCGAIHHPAEFLTESLCLRNSICNGRQVRQLSAAQHYYGYKNVKFVGLKNIVLEQNRTLRLGSWNTLTCREVPDALARAYLWD